MCCDALTVIVHLTCGFVEDVLCSTDCDYLFSVCVLSSAACVAVP